MARVLALLLTFALLFQSCWAAAAAYCEHEAPSPTAAHFGHHAHDHKGGDGQKQPGGKLALDDDCAFCHAGHPAIVPAPFACAAPVPSAAIGVAAPRVDTSAPPGVPERPQWTGLA